MWEGRSTSHRAVRRGGWVGGPWRTLHTSVRLLCLRFGSRPTAPWVPVALPIPDRRFALSGTTRKQKGNQGKGRRNPSINPSQWTLSNCSKSQSWTLNIPLAVSWWPQKGFKGIIPCKWQSILRNLQSNFGRSIDPISNPRTEPEMDAKTPLKREVKRKKKGICQVSNPVTSPSTFRRPIHHQMQIAPHSRTGHPTNDYRHLIV